METIRIPLGRSGIAEAWATIDFEDYERVALYRWYLNADGYPFIAYAKDRKTTYMHNYVLGREDKSDGLQVDHIDRDPLNTRKSNLRLVTKTENMANTSTADRASNQATSYKEIAQRLRRSGVSARRIAGGLGISISAVERYCVGIDNPSRRKEPWTKEAVTEAVRNYWIRTGRMPSSGDLGNDGLPWPSAAYKFFPTLADLHHAASA